MIANLTAKRTHSALPSIDEFIFVFLSNVPRTKSLSDSFSCNVFAREKQIIVIIPSVKLAKDSSHWSPLNEPESTCEE